MNESHPGERSVSKDAPLKGVGRAANGILLMKIGLAIFGVGFALVFISGKLPGETKLLTALPALAALPFAIGFTLLGEVRCLLAPTRWRGRRWLLLVFAIELALGAALAWSGAEHRRHWTSFSGLALTAAMCLYLNDLAEQFHQPEARDQLIRLQQCWIASGVIGLVIGSWQPQALWRYLLAMGLGLSLGVGVQAYWRALTDLRSALLEAETRARWFSSGKDCAS